MFLSRLSPYVFALMLMLASTACLPLSGQQPVGQRTPSVQPSSLSRLQILSRRLQHKYGSRDHATESKHRQMLEQDRQLMDAGNRSGFYPPVHRANRIGSTTSSRSGAQVGYQQPIEGFNNFEQGLDDGWPAESTPDSNLRHAPQNTSTVGMTNSLRPNQNPMLVPQGSGTRNVTNGVSSQYYNQANYDDPGIIGIHGASQQPRFKHFSSRIPASERAIMLEDELQRVQKRLRAKEVDNQVLQNKLDQNERLLVEIQTSIDEAINQLTDAAAANQQLRDKVAQLEAENQQQKIKSDRLLDEVRGQLRDLLAAELTGGK